MPRAFNEERKKGPEAHLSCACGQSPLQPLSGQLRTQGCPWVLGSRTWIKQHSRGLQSVDYKAWDGCWQVEKGEGMSGRTEG